MSGDLERLARALCIYDGDDPDAELGPGYPYWKGEVPAIRAILQALREPSDEAFFAGETAVERLYEADAVSTTSEESRASWRGVIDHILSEPTP